MRTTNRVAGPLCLAALFFLMSGCKPATPTALDVSTAGPAAEVVQAPPPAWVTFVERYIEDYFTAHPAFAVVQRRHEYDGMLPDWSADGITREITRLKKNREDALAFDALELGKEGEFQRAYLVAVIDRALFWLDTAEWPFVNPAFYFDWMTDSLDPGPYIALDYAPLADRMRSFTRYASNIPLATRQIRANLRMPMARTRLQYGIDSFGGLADYFRDDVPSVFASVEDPSLQAGFAQANSAAVAAMQDLTVWLQSQLNTSTEDYALGPEMFRQMIYDTERVDLPLEELEAMGLADMKRNQIALGEACAEFAPGKNIRNCFAMMANRKPPAGAVETRIGQLSNALLHNARFLSAIGLHTKGMTVEESAKLFMDEAYQDEVTARQQAARGTYDPAYLNYTLEEMMSRALPEDWTASRDGQQSWRDFHDTFLSYGGPPIPLVRARMMGAEEK